MITALAVVVGVALGIIVGRLVWKQVAAGVEAVDLVSWPLFLVAPVVALVVMVAVASLLGRRAVQLQPARVLRSE